MTWRNIKVDTTEVTPQATYDRGQLMIVDKYGAPVASPTSLTDIGRRIVEVRREARKSMEALEFATRAQVQENASLRVQIKEVDERWAWQDAQNTVERLGLKTDIEELRNELESLTVVEDLRMIGRRIESSEKRFEKEKDSIINHINDTTAALYNTVTNSVRSVNRELVLREARLAKKANWLLAGWVMSLTINVALAGFLLWGLR